MYWTIANWKTGDTAALITDDKYIMVEVLKIKGSAPPGEPGNVQVRNEEGDCFWVLGGKLLSEEGAQKQLAYERRRNVNPRNGGEQES